MHLTKLNTKFKPCITWLKQSGRNLHHRFVHLFNFMKTYNNSHLYFNCTQGHLPASVSVAPTRFYTHMFVSFQHNIVCIVKIKHLNGGKPGRRAAWFWYIIGSCQVDKRLNDCVIGGVHLSAKWKWTLPSAVEGWVSFWGNYPVLKDTNSTIRLAPLLCDKHPDLHVIYKITFIDL